MASDGNNVFSSLIALSPTVAPVYVQEHGVIHGKQDHVLRELCFGLLLTGENSDFFHNANKWSMHRLDPLRHHYFWGFLLVCLAVEDKSLGAKMINVAPSSSTYRRSITNLCKVMCHKATSEERAFVGRHLEDSHYVNLHQQQHIRQAMDKMIQAAQRANEENDEENNEDEELDFHQNDPVAPDDHFTLFFELIDRPDTLFQVVDECIPVRPTLAQRRFFQTEIFDHIDVMNQAGNIDNLVDDEDLRFLNQANMERSSHAVPKVTPTVVAIPSADDPNVIVGLLVRFLIHDPVWNCGQIVYNLLDDEKQRQRTINYGQGKKNTSVDRWAHYAGFRGQWHPAQNMSFSAYLDCYQQITGRIAVGKELDDLMAHFRCDEYDTRLHPNNLFTLERALQRLRTVNADPNVLSQIRFDRDNNVAYWPPNLDVYTYRPEQWFWYHTEKIGLRDQFFPHLVKPHAHMDEYERGIYEISRSKPVITRKQVELIMPKLLPYKTNNMLTYLGAEADQKEIAVVKLLPENSTAQFKMAQHYVGHLDEMPSDLFNWLQQYTEYADSLNQMRNQCMEQFLNFFQLDGNVDYLPIPNTLKAMLRYYQKAWADKDHLSRPVDIVDPDMSLLANSIAMEFMLLRKWGGLGQPLITWITHFLCSVYSRRNGKLNFNVLVHGPPDCGKSWHVVEFPKLFMWIEDTFVCEIGKTAAADTTDEHIEDLIRLGDEAPQWYVNSKLAAQHPREVNEKKSALTSGIITLKEFQFVNAPNNQRLRSSRYVTTIQDYVEAMCTNEPVEAREALSSRFSKWIMKVGQVRAEELKQIKPTKYEQRQLSTYLRLDQFLSCWVEKAALVGAICRDPFLGVFGDGSARILDYLREIGVVDETKGIRALDIMKPLVRKLVCNRALHWVYDAPGAPLYQKKFHPAQMRIIEPYLYDTVQTLIFVWTVLIKEWIDEDLHNVLQAVCRVADYDYSQQTPYQILVNDMENRVPFFTRRNELYSKRTRGEGPAYIVDLNYIELFGTPNEIAQLIAPHTKPMLHAKDVEGVIARAMTETFRPQVVSSHSGQLRNGYAPIEQTRIEDHRRSPTAKKQLRVLNWIAPYTEYLDDMIKKQSFVILSRITDVTHDADGFSRLQLHPRFQTKELFYAVLLTSYTGTLNEVAEATYQHFNRPLNVMQTSDLKRVCVNISLDESLIHRDDQDPAWYEIAMDPERFGLTYIRAQIILYALNNSFIMELGVQAREYPGQRSNIFHHEDEIPPLAPMHDSRTLPVIKLYGTGAQRRVCFAPCAIEKYDRNVILDAFEEAVLCAHFKPQKLLLGWPHPQDVSMLQTIAYTQDYIDEFVLTKDFHGQQFGHTYIPRAQGIPFKRQNFQTEQVQEFLKAFDADKSPEVPYVRQETIEIIGDLDEWSALQQHIICGRPLDEPIRTPRFLKSQYRGDIGQANYPNDLLTEKRVLDQGVWFVNFAAGQKATRKPLTLLRKKSRPNFGATDNYDHQQEEPQQGLPRANGNHHRPVEQQQQQSAQSVFANVIGQRN